MTQPPLLAVLPGGRPATGRHSVVPADLAVRADIPDQAFRLYAILASRAQRGTRIAVWTRADLVTLTGLSSRSVRRLVANLAAVGAVEILGAWWSNGDYWTRYRLPVLWTTDP